MLIDTVNCICSSESAKHKDIISLKENPNHREHFVESTRARATYYKYYTFYVDKQSIIKVTHKRKYMGNAVGESQTSLSNSSVHTHTSVEENIFERLKEKPSSKNNDNCVFTVEQNRISYQEFSMIYFEHLTSFLHRYFFYKIGIISYHCRFCIIRNSLSNPQGLTLTDEDVFSIAAGCGMLSTNGLNRRNRLLVLERAQATAIFCRAELCGSFRKYHPLTHFSFIQIQLAENRCDLLLYKLPHNGEEGHAYFMSEGEKWSAIHRYAESKTIPFNLMEIICDNLWIHMQKHEQILKKCGRHWVTRWYFNSKNMKVFNNLLHKYMCKVSAQFILYVAIKHKVNSIFVMYRQIYVCQTAIK